jgi:hypothetical protein
MKKALDDSIQKGVVTGSLKFPNLYCSQLQIFKATQEWANEDKGLIYASVRTDGTDFIALDFRYDEHIKKENHKSILYDFLKNLFKEKLGEDYIQAWSISRDSIIIK